MPLPVGPTPANSRIFGPALSAVQFAARLDRNEMSWAGINMRDNGPVTNEEFVLPDDEVIITRTDAGGRIIYANDAFIESSQFSLGECLGQPQNIVRHPEMPAAAFEDLWRTIRGGRPWTGLVKNRRKSGGFYWVRAHVTPIMEKERVVGYMSVRTKAKPDEIAATDKLYRNMRSGLAKHLVLRGGQVVDTRWWRRLISGWRISIATGALLIACSVVVVFAATVTVALEWPAHSALARLLAAVACTLVVGNAFYVRLKIAKPLRLASDSVMRVIGGDMNLAFPGSSDYDTGQLLSLINQMNGKLIGVLKDAHSGIVGVDHGANEIAHVNEELSTRSSARAAGLEETAASIEELTATVKGNANNATVADELTRRASDVTQRGRDVVFEVVNTMQSIGAASRKIGDILSIMNAITFQTNLLALNAAVEAARAGEQGRGFAVVAQEVRALAQRSTSAAKEIKSLIEDSLQRVESGERLARDASATMEEVVLSVKRVNDIMGEIASASRDQSTGIQAVSRTIGDMDRMTQEDAAMAGHVIQIASALKQRSARAMEAISAFSLHSVATESMQTPTPRIAKAGTVLAFQNRTGRAAQMDRGSAA
jgi:aerotaxis receptor